MSDGDVATVKVKATQRARAKRATREMFMAKKPRQTEFTTSLFDADRPSTILFRAVGTLEYDELVSQHPAKVDQRAAGSPFNIHTFAPALLARTVAEPEMSEEDWVAIWKSKDWNQGEVMALFNEAVAVCSERADLTPTAAG